MLSRVLSVIRSHYTIRNRTAISSYAIAAACLLFSATSTFAQEQASGDDQRGATSALLEEVIVTARKREEESQDVPIAISAYTGSQIEALKIRDLKGLSVAMPNVAMDDIATSRGVANFSIRGLGINSSIPGIDPTPWACLLTACTWRKTPVWYWTCSTWPASKYCAARREPCLAAT